MVKKKKKKLSKVEPIQKENTPLPSKVVKRYAKATKWSLGFLGAITAAVLAWFLTAPNVFSLGKIYPPGQVFARSLNPGQFTVRGNMAVKLKNFSLRPASVKAEIVPKGVVIFHESEKNVVKRIERIPETFEISRSIVDVSDSAVPPFRTRDVRAEYLLKFKLISKRVVYVYKLRWIVDNQGEVDSACLRFPVWSPGAPSVSDIDSKELPCD